MGAILVLSLLVWIPAGCIQSKKDKKKLDALKKKHSDVHAQRRRHSFAVREGVPEAVNRSQVAPSPDTQYEMARAAAQRAREMQAMGKVSPVTKIDVEPMRQTTAWAESVAEAFAEAEVDVEDEGAGSSIVSSSHSGSRV